MEASYEDGELKWMKPMDETKFALLAQRFEDYIVNVDNRWKHQDAFQEEVRADIKDIKKAMASLPCDSRGAVNLERKAWIDKNVTALWATIGGVFILMIAEWVKRK